MGGDLEQLEKEGFKHDDIESYLISPIDERDWFSDQYANCTAVIAIGRDAKTGKEISFLSHQDPRYFINGDDESMKKFASDIIASLQELRDRSEQDTVEVSLAGGNFNATFPESEDYHHNYYQKSIEKLRQLVQESLGFDPKVLTGPNNRVGSETIIVVDTQNRTVWIERPEQPAEFDKPYQANELDQALLSWTNLPEDIQVRALETEKGLRILYELFGEAERIFGSTNLDDVIARENSDAALTASIRKEVRPLLNAITTQLQALSRIKSGESLRQWNPSGYLSEEQFHILRKRRAELLNAVGAISVDPVTKKTVYHHDIEPINLIESEFGQ